MKLKIAIVGPEALVHDICSVINEFDEVDPLPMIYDSEQQSSYLLAEPAEFIDSYIFSGPAPFYLSMESLPPESNSLYIPFEGADIYRVLLRIYEHYHFFPVIGFDTLNPQHLFEVYKEIEVPHIPFFIKSMEGYWDSEELFNYHLDLWKEKKVQVIATALYSVYKRLKLLNIPVFLIKHTKQTIRDTVGKTVLAGLKQKKANAQITVLQFQIDEPSDSSDGTSKELTEIKERILEYGNRLFSSSNVLSRNKITLYTTRGALEKVTKQGKDLTILNEISSIYSCRLSLGIGMGYSGESANSNAEKALLYANEKGESCGFLIDDEKRIHGPLGTNRSIEYSLVHIEKGSSNSLTLRKFYAWISMMKKERVTAKEVSIGMNASDRHASRILKTLYDKGIAKICGKESMNQKGRPRPIYEINLIKLAEEIYERSP
ncbi:hypothetical protein ACLHDF_02320 [Priestia aryabhattai]|uniref:hypothetical protein n=1 Tax=Priestia megaterium TaxID=1404 RepID=UPI0039B843B9